MPPQPASIKGITHLQSQSGKYVYFYAEIHGN